MPHRRHHRRTLDDIVEHAREDDTLDFLSFGLNEDDMEFDDDAEDLLEELAHLSPDYPVLRRHWVLRAWLGVRPERIEIYLRHHRQSRLLTALGIQMRGPVGSSLQRQLSKLDLEPVTADLRPPFGNITAIAAALGLAPLERELLLLAAMLHLDPTLYAACQPLGEFSRRGACAALATMLSASADAVYRALLPNGLLARTGLIRIDDSHRYHLKAKLDILDHLPQLLLGERLDTTTLFQHYVAPACPATLTASDFAHRAEDFDLARQLLAKAAASATPGVNLLLYGPPGTGKT